MQSMAKAPKHWDIFLSHSHDDKPFADWLYQKLVDAGLTIWYDAYELLVGDSLIFKIAEGLDGSDIVIVVISRKAIQSNWVKAELEPKILQQIEEQKVTVLCTALDGLTSGDISTFLKAKVYVSFPRKGSDQAFVELLKSIRANIS
jgi:hypothetical protein